MYYDLRENVGKKEEKGSNFISMEKKKSGIFEDG